MKKRAYLSTFAGVFTPSILTILGIILFLRLGYIVGEAGLSQTLIIVALANLISILTSLSLAAIATNMQVKAGGDYYLISRTLGHSFGGAIGIVLFLAQTVSIAFYCLGFAELVATLLPQLFVDIQAIAALAILVLFVFAWLGADWATRFQYVVMACLVLALASFFIGAYQHWNIELFHDNLAVSGNDVSFWTVFALFFPAVTGFTQGVSMSGELKDPGHSLPLGTFSAVLLSVFIYFIAVFFYAGSISRHDLLEVPNPMTQVALSDSLIVIGVFAATLSSAMASYLGAPRILQSLSRDRLWKSLMPFGKGEGSNDNPRRGVLLATAIALLTVYLGQLNMIAPVVTMFFLISYGLINFATYFEASSKSPSFRPVFRWFNADLSLLGSLLCLGAMLAVNILAGLTALIVLLSIYFYLRNTGMRSRWADGWRSYHLYQVREHLLAAFREPAHPRDWRPNFLLFPMNYPGRQTLYRFATLLEAQSGFTTVVRIVLGQGVELIKRKQEQELALQEELQQEQLPAFPLVVTAPSIDTGIHTLIQAYGIGPLRANTVLLPWPIGEGWDIHQPGHSYAHHLRIAMRLQCNLLIMVEPQIETADLLSEHEDTRIDIWWSGGASSNLALLLAYLLQRNDNWRESKLRLLCTPYQNKPVDLEYLKHYLADIRIPAEVEAVEAINPEILKTQSTDAGMIFLPFRLHQEQFLTINGEPLADLLPGLPTTALVLANRDFELEDEPETGKAAEIAEILDALEDARDLHQHYQQLLEKLHKEKEKLLEQEYNALELEQINLQIDKISRRKGKAAAKLQLAEQQAAKLD